MHILLVDNARGWGGAEEQVLSLAKGLERRGHSLRVVARRGGAPEKRFRDGGLAVSPFTRDGFAVLFASLRASAQARREKPAVIHVHRDHDLPVGKLLSLASGAPLILTQHCMPKRPGTVLYSMARRVVVVSNYIAGGVRAGVPSIANRLSVIHNGINPSMFRDPDRGFWRAHPRVGDRTPLVGTVGSFYKGQEELVAMLPRLRAEFPRIALILIGDDPGRKGDLIATARRSGVSDAVVFAGWIPRERMKDALAGLDLNVSAFRNEGFGLSVIEGFAVGTPFVGYRSGGYPEILSACGGGILAGSVEEFQSAVAAGLRDPEWRSRVGREARESVFRAFPFEGMLDRYEALYSDAAGAGGAGREAGSAC